MLFRIKNEYAYEDSLYYHIDTVKINRKDGGMVEVYDIHDGNYFWIKFSKLERVIERGE